MRNCIGCEYSRKQWTINRYCESINLDIKSVNSFPEYFLRWNDKWHCWIWCMTNMHIVHTRQSIFMKLKIYQLTLRSGQWFCFAFSGVWLSICSTSSEHQSVTVSQGLHIHIDPHDMRERIWMRLIRPAESKFQAKHAAPFSWIS